LVKNNLRDITKTVGLQKQQAETKQTTSTNKEVETCRKKLEDNTLKGLTLT